MSEKRKSRRRRKRSVNLILPVTAAALVLILAVGIGLFAVRNMRGGSAGSAGDQIAFRGALGNAGGGSAGTGAASAQALASGTSEPETKDPLGRRADPADWEPYAEDGTPENPDGSTYRHTGITYTPLIPSEIQVVENWHTLPNENGTFETAEEGKIYSYIQQEIKYYNGDPKWAGEWAHITAAGREFINFGCGICCLSNIYSTFQQKPVTPDLVYDWAKQYVAYDPDSGIGAMSWSQLKGMITRYGMTAETKHKPADYAQFQRDMYEADACIVLVCKDNDARLWWYTNGHYVNVWAYDYASDSLFLSDASGLFNRARVPARWIYDALKTASDAQYLVVNPA
ncbi:MAG: hypothetical protein Q4E57_07790 [Eubacteriales bacterium]|nr:hypothetical protein [Eubacteriales bacterium]